MLVWHVMYVLITCMIGGHVVYVRVAWYASMKGDDLAGRLLCLWGTYCTYNARVHL